MSARNQFGTGGVTEFVALPFAHLSSPLYLACVLRDQARQIETTGRARAGEDQVALQDLHDQNGWVKPKRLGQARERAHAGGAH
jgi:hypothetical protein